MATNYIGLNFIMLGESGVGKTSLLERFCKNTFREEHRSTLGIDKFTKTVVLRDTQINLLLWDTVGQERFRTIVKTYFRKAEGVLLVYDMTQYETFMAISSWLDDLRELNEEATVLIVGNKADLRHLNNVSATTVENFAKEKELEFCEASAKNNENVDAVFEKLALKVLERKKIAPFFKEISKEKEEKRNEPRVEIKKKEEETTNTASISVQTDDIFVLSLADDKPKKKKGCC